MRRSKNYRIGSRISLDLSLLLGISLLLTATSNAAKPVKPPPDPPPEGDSIDLGGGFVEHMGFVSAGDTGVDFTNESIRHMAVSIGQLGGVNPETGEVIINEGNLLPMVAQELDITGSAYFYTNVYIAGDSFVYGTLYGSGEGLTNIPLANITGSLTDWTEIESALDQKLDADGVWVAIFGNASTVSNLLQSIFVLKQAAASWDTAYLWGNHADEDYASCSDVDIHCNATDNPHQMQASQIGALPAIGGKMAGDIDMVGAARITNLPEPANDNDAVTRSYLDKRLNYIEPQGGLEMGIYTNSPDF